MRREAGSVDVWMVREVVELFLDKYDGWRAGHTLLSFEDKKELSARRRPCAS